MTKEQKVESLKKELEEATSLELPMLSKNLVVISTCASIATLIGLIGTVMGMIRSFAAMSQGAPDTAQLATGISEALINTFFGIAGSTIAIIMYNFFSTKIDSMTYSIDEASFALLQEFSAAPKQNDTAEYQIDEVNLKGAIDENKEGESVAGEENEDEGQQATKH
jgi:biopolymer transport protein ExbB